MTTRVPNIAATLGRSFVRRWCGFWFGEERMYTLGLVRIAFGALMTVWTLMLYPNLDAMFGPKGVLPRSPAPDFTWSVFRSLPEDDALLVGWLILLLASIALTVGWRSRLAAVLVFVLVMSFERRNPFVMNAGDVLLRIEALFIALAPSGAALSLDRRRKAGSFWSAEKRRVWPLRLMQIQVSIIYLSTVVAKLDGVTWQEGTAVSYSLRQADLLFFPLPTWITHNLMLSNVLSWGTLVIELAIGLMVWNRRWRPWVLGAGVVLHLSIFVSMAIGLFSLAVFVLYLAFIPADRAQLIAGRLAERLTRSKPRPPRPVEEPLPGGSELEEDKDADARPAVFDGDSKRQLSQRQRRASPRHAQASSGSR